MSNSKADSALTLETHAEEKSSSLRRRRRIGGRTWTRPLGTLGPQRLRPCDPLHGSNQCAAEIEGADATETGELVLLNVYDINNSGTVQSLNNLFRAVGTGVFHVGLQVYSSEWSFGFAEGEETGVFSCIPREYWLGTHRETVVLGRTFHSELAVLDILEQMSVNWPGQSYDLLHKNCGHFCALLCNQLSTGSLPIWVTNLAGAGATLDAGIQVVSTNVKAAAATVAGGLDELDSHGRIRSAVESGATSVQAVVGDIDQHDVRKTVTGAFSSLLMAAREVDENWKVSERVGTGAHSLVAAAREADDTWKVSERVENGALSLVAATCELDETYQVTAALTSLASRAVDATSTDTHVGSRNLYSFLSKHGTLSKPP